MDPMTRLPKATYLWAAALALALAVSPAALSAEESPPGTSRPGGAEQLKNRSHKSEKLPEPGSPEERDRVLANLYGQLAKADNAATAKALAETIERIWQVSGSDTIDLLMARAGLAQLADDKVLALELMDSVVRLEPKFAEGWNRRAAIFFSLERYEETVADLARALVIDPNHYKAIQGLSVTLKELSKDELALKAYRKLLSVYPLVPDAKPVLEELERKIEGQKI